jgi:hypothetical protein
MKTFSTLLERLSKVLNRETFLQTQVLETIKEITHLSLEQKNISLQDGVLVVKGSPVLKNEIKLKEEKIVAHLRERCKLTILRVVYK